MKKFINTLVLFFIFNLGFAQSAFDKYDGLEGVDAIVVNKKMFQMMASLKMDAGDIETQQYLTLIKKLDNLKVFTTTNAKATADMKLFTTTYVKSAGLTEILKNIEAGKNSRIYAKMGENQDQLKEILVFNEGITKENETVLLSLTGNFSLNEISVLIDKMKIQGVSDLKKMSQKK